VLRVRPRWPVALSVTALAGLLAWLVWPAPPAIPGADRVRQYLNVRACLLTGSDGIAGKPAAAAWAGLEDASASTRAMVSYLSVPGAATRTAALPYLAGLVQRQCSVIVAVGDAQVAAVAADASKFRQVRFVVVTSAAAGPGVTRISAAPAAQVRGAVQAAVTTALHDA